MSSVTVFTHDEVLQFGLVERFHPVESMYKTLQLAYPDQPQYSWSQYANMSAELNNNGHAALCSTNISLRYRNNRLRIASDITKKTESDIKVSSTENLLPLAIRYIAPNHDMYVERYPFQIEVDFADHNRKPYIKKSDQIKIWVPWTITRFNHRNMSFDIFYSYKSLTSKEDHYFSGALPNSYSNGNLCWGSSLNKYPDLQINASTGLMEETDPKNVFNILFNEYFSGGWNTDLGSHIFYYLNYVPNRFKNLDQFPMVQRFLCPDPDHIHDRFRHLSAARRKLLANGLTNVGPNRLKQCAYVLYMLSDFTLAETLDFYRELTSMGSFSDYVEPLEKIYLRSKNYSHGPMSDGSFNWEDLYRTPPRDSITNSLLSEHSAQEVFFYYYNFKAEQSWYIYRNLLPLRSGSMRNAMLTDYIADHYNKVSQSHVVYMVDIGNEQYTKMEIPYADADINEGYLTGICHHAFEFNYKQSIALKAGPIHD